MIPPFPFDPGRFYRRLPYASFWTWLWLDHNITLMETASSRGGVAVEPLAPGLIADFGLNAVKGYAVRQMLGRMARLILEYRGWRIIRSGFKVKTGGVFTCGAKYDRLKDVAQDVPPEDS